MGQKQVADRTIMTEENTMVNVPQEGEISFQPENEEDTSSDSPTENNEDETQSPEGEEENTQDDGDDPDADDTDKDVPFHKHPRWTQREKEWQDRFNEQEQRHQDDIKAVREEFAAARKDNKENTEIPGWFGGTQEQWNEYRQWNDQQIKAAEDRALARLDENRSAESKAVKEATDFMRAEITTIESDKTLNPEGKKVDPNKLLKFVMENELVDSKGRWNYRAGWRFMQNQPAQTVAPKPKTQDRKVIAGVTTSDPKGEQKPKTFKTSDDFKSSKPW